MSRTTHRLRDVESELSIRRASPDELPSIIDLATAALGWDATQPNEAFFRWKHLENPAGPSPMWVAAHGDTLAGFRSMMRWRFTDGGGELAAVRAVDTATHPDHQRRGIFRALTMTAVDELTAEGTDFVINTPNDRSRPGYLRMGWVDAGRLPVRFAVRGISALPRLLRARTAAHKWSEPLTAGEPIDTVAADLVRLHGSGVVTVRDEDHLRWRYGFEPLHYRVVQTDAAAAVVRVRRRGGATEAVVAEVVADSARATRDVFATVRRLPGVDHLLTLANPPFPAPPLAPIPGLGPHLTLRDLGTLAPPVDGFRFSLGDIELF